MATDSASLTVLEVPLEDTLDLRERALSPGHEGRPVIWPYDYDTGARNFGVIDSQGDRLVACLSVGPKGLEGFSEADTFRFHSMAVEPDMQRNGIGSRMLQFVVSDLAQHGAAFIWATARDSAVGFYERFGMRVLEDRTFLVEETGFECKYVVLPATDFETVIAVRN